jgi:hypothetical protein
MSMNSPQLLDRKPRGSVRRKYADLALLLVIAGGMSLWSSNVPLDATMLAVFCVLAAGLAAIDVYAMWRLKPRRIYRWLGMLSDIAAVGVILVLVVLDAAEQFTWNHLYFVAPAVLYLGFTALGAWVTEWRKSVLIYEGVGVIAYVRPPAPPLGRAARAGLVVLALVAAWLAFVTLHDENPDPGFNDFYFGRHVQVPDEQNIAIGTSGLSAPAGADFMEYGRYASGIWRSGVPGDVARARIESRGKLDFTGRNEDLQCWDEPIPRPRDSKCGPLENVVPLPKANAELLARYRRLYALPHSSGVAYKRSLEINLNKLIASEILLDLRDGRNEIAYNKWRDNQQFLRRMIGEEETWIDKAIDIFLESISMATAEQLIRAAPKLADAHYREMEDLLRPGGVDRYNLAGVMRAEYLLRDPVYSNSAALKFWVHPGFIRNRFFRYAQDFLNASQTPPLLVAAAIDVVTREQTTGWSVDYLRDPLNTVFARTQIAGPAKTGQLVQQMAIHDGQLRLLLLRLDILHGHIADDGIEAFLQSAGADLRNPFTGEPMQWAASKRALYFRIPGDKPLTMEVTL